jgi:hypothetical protein
MIKTALGLLLALPLSALFYDVIQKHQLPPPGVECIAWADAPDKFNQHWAAGKPPADAANHCAQQAKGSAESPCVQSSLDHGSICPQSYCITANLTQVQCRSTTGVPEQINIQIASPNSVVVGFVTFEKTAPTRSPVVMYGAGPKDDFNVAEDKNVTGVTHLHNTLKLDRPYYMHFVLLTDLKPNAVYHYRVAAGSDDAEVSDAFQFRGPYGGADGPNGTTRIALYGDMGVYPWNNMQNLLEDTAGTAEEAKMDLIIHAGDHCYNEGDVDERRADGYMQAFEKTIGNVPWMPIVGNHEFYGTNLGRFLNQTWEGWGPLPMKDDGPTTASGSAPAAHTLPGGTSATSALGVS